MTPRTTDHLRARPQRRHVAAAGALLALALGAGTADAKTKIGSPGSDTLRAGSSGDLLWGGGGADKLIGGDGPDRLYGVRSANKIYGNGGDDYIEGGAGDDDISTGPGNNTVFSSSGHDHVRTGDGNNYVDVGGGQDEAVLGNGNNVLVTASGGGKFELGNGNNVVYYGSGVVYLTAGSGVNTFYLSNTAAVRKLDCGGNPASRVLVNANALHGRPYAMQIFQRKIKGCPNIATFDGETRIRAKMAGMWTPFKLSGGAGRDKLFGGHGGGSISGGEGDNEIWADQFQETGLPRSKRYTTRITAGNGNNRIFGGRGTNVITAGNGDNFVRAGAYVNRITLGSGDNLVRLQGRGGRNTVSLSGRGIGEGSFIESLANGRRPVIRCFGGAKATIVYGRTKPKTTCGTKPVSVYTPKGKRLQVEHTPGYPAADPVVEGQIGPGEQGYGVARPTPGG